MMADDERLDEPPSLETEAPRLETESLPLETAPDRGEPSPPPDPRKCPHCGADHAPEQGRFCDVCGMSVIAYAAASQGEGIRPDQEGEEAPTVRCRSCGTKSFARQSSALQ